MYDFCKNYVALFYSRNKFEINSGELTELYHQINIYM